MSRLRSLPRVRSVELTAELFVVLVVFAAIFGPALPLDDPKTISNDVLRGPSMGHLLGTDELGRDVLSGLVVGARLTLIVGFGAALMSTVVGTIVGALAGYFGGVLDNLLMRVSELFQIMPNIVLATLMVALYGAGTLQVVLVIALLAWPQTARVVRSEIRRLRDREFVDVSRCLGTGNLRILVRELLPNALGAIMALTTLVVANAILLQAALNFLGVGDVGAVSWGRLLNSGQRFLFQAWWLSFFPGLAILLTVVALSIAGDHLARRLDPRGLEGLR